MTSLLVVNLHGLINVPAAARETLVELGIGKRFAATVVADDATTVGALELCKEYVAWSPIDAELLASLLKARGKVSNAKPLGEEGLKALGAKDYEDLATKMIKDSSRLSSLKGVKPYFGLSPPRGGFRRSSRRQFGQGGILGKNPKLPEIVRSMI